MKFYIDIWTIKKMKVVLQKWNAQTLNHDIYESIKTVTIKTVTIKVKQ